MRACLVVCVAAALVGAVCSECTGCIEGQCYRKHSLPGVFKTAVDIDRNTDELYVTNQNILQQCRLDIGLCTNITDQWDIYRLAVDQRTGVVYARIVTATTNGLYKLNLVDKERKLLVRSGIDEIWVKDKVYYSPWLGHGIFSYENGESRIVGGTEEYVVSKFIVDKKGDVYFETFFNGESVLRRLSEGAVDPNVYWKDNYMITVDKDDNAMFIHKQSHAIYRVTDGRLAEVGAIDDSIFYFMSDTPIFDSDNNIIYRNNSRDYFYLKRDKGVNCTISILQNKRIISEIVATAEGYHENDSVSHTLETSTTSSRKGYTEVNDDMTHSTPDSAASTPRAPGQRSHHTDHVQQSSCNCHCTCLHSCQKL